MESALRARAVRVGVGGGGGGGRTQEAGATLAMRTYKVVCCVGRWRSEFPQSGYCFLTKNSATPAQEALGYKSDGVSPADPIFFVSRLKKHYDLVDIRL